MASVPGAYLNCIWELILNEYQNGIRVWSIYELYLRIDSELVSEWHPCLERICTVSVYFEYLLKIVVNLILKRVTC